MSPVCQRNTFILLTKVKHKRKPLDVHRSHSLALRGLDDGNCRGQQPSGESIGRFFYLHFVWFAAHGYRGVCHGNTRKT